MSNIKNLIEKTFLNNEKISNTINILSDIQNNLVKNYSNPVFNSKDKNKLIKMHNTVNEIGKSFYRINAFNENHMTSEAEKEKDEISNTVLKGGISNVKFVWHSENGENTCEKCKSLDGTTYDFEDEVPQRPHPNCKCHVEIVEDKKEENKDACDCHKFIEQFDELINQANTLRQVISIKSANILEIMKYDTFLYIEGLGQWLLEQYTNMDNFIGDLTKTFVESRQDIYENSDKYYHMKAYCKVAQRESEITNMLAHGVGIIRECGQLLVALLNHHNALEDFRNDFRANQTGTQIGKNYPGSNCDSVLEMLWPDILDQIFKQ